MSARLQRMFASAARRMGTTITLRLKTFGTYDPATGAATSTDSDVTVAAVRDTSLEEVDTLAEKYLVPRRGLESLPETLDSVVIDSKPRTVLGIDKDPLGVMYILSVKR